MFMIKNENYLYKINFFVPENAAEAVIPLTVHFSSEPGHTSHW